MYEALALAIEMNKGKPEDVKTTLGYAADLALRDPQPERPGQRGRPCSSCTRQYDRVGPLLDLAAEKVPHRAEPLMMSINLAQKTKDPKRMADAVERLLSLGWPGDRRARPLRGAASRPRRSPRRSARRAGATRPTPCSPGSPRPRPATSSSA